MLKRACSSERRLPYGITPRNCHPTQVNTSLLTRVKHAGTQFTYPTEMRS